MYAQVPFDPKTRTQQTANRTEQKAEPTVNTLLMSKNPTFSMTKNKQLSYFEAQLKLNIDIFNPIILGFQYRDGINVVKDYTSLASLSQTSKTMYELVGKMIDGKTHHDAWAAYTNTATCSDPCFQRCADISVARNYGASTYVSAYSCASAGSGAYGVHAMWVAPGCCAPASNCCVTTSIILGGAMGGMIGGLIGAAITLSCSCSFPFSSCWHYAGKNALQNIQEDNKNAQIAQQKCVKIHNIPKLDTLANPLLFTFWEQTSFFGKTTRGTQDDVTQSNTIEPRIVHTERLMNAYDFKSLNAAHKNGCKLATLTLARIYASDVFTIPDKFMKKFKGIEVDHVKAKEYLASLQKSDDNIHKAYIAIAKELKTFLDKTSKNNEPDELSSSSSSISLH